MLKVLSILFIVAGFSEAVVFEISKKCKIDSYTICHDLDYSDASEIFINPDQTFPQSKAFRVKTSKFRLIPRNLFTVMPNLESCSLAEGIERIEKDDFVNATKLGILNLSSNTLQILPENIFQNVPNLKWLSISANKISEIHVTAFAGLKKLTLLELLDNKIKFLPQGIFDDLQSLQTLRLNDNEIETIDENLFINNRDLQILSLENNRISKIVPSTFKRLPQLQTLGLSSNPIEELYINSINLLAVESTGMKNLVINGTVQILLAGKNEISRFKIQDVSKTHWMKLGCTRDVDLSFLKDAQLLENLTLEGGSPNLEGLSAIRETLKLKELTIHNANVTEIPENIFDHLENVNRLSITKNPLQTVNVKEILKLKKLEYLSLAENEIAELNYKPLVDNLRELKGLDLKNNRFKSSDLAEIYSYLQQKKLKI